MAFEVKDISYNIENEIESVTSLLEKHNLKLDSFVEKTIGVYEQDLLIATGSIAGNTLRSICIDEEYRGTSVINTLVSHLLNLLYDLSCTHFFIYTGVDAYRSFIKLGFHLVIKLESGIVLMENKANGIQDYLKEIKNITSNRETCEKPIIGSIVINGNPFTNGHRHLIDLAKEHCDLIYIFVVWEENSVFPNEVRYRLIEEGISDLNGIVLCKGENYIISSATFPTYFLKDVSESVQQHAILDLTIFRDIIAPYLGITKRFIGEERLCETTNIYNQTMIKLMEGSPITVTEIKRKESDNEIISASHVRRYIKENKWSEIKKVVPKTTYDFLNSKGAEPIIAKISNSSSRH